MNFIGPKAICGWCYRGEVRDACCLECGALRIAPKLWRIPKRETEHHRELLNPDVLARLLFRTDPEVRAFVHDVADALSPWGPKFGKEHLFPVERRRSFSEERFRATLDRAWERDEKGLATRARQRAESMLNISKGEAWRNERDEWLERGWESPPIGTVQK